MGDLTNPAGPELTSAIHGWAGRIATVSGHRAAEVFSTLMLDTRCTTMSQIGDRTFVITGDIPAMWLRDSSAQVLPFVQLTDDAEVSEVLHGLVREQWRCIALEPYANAFNSSGTGAHFDTDDLELHPGVWERKYEIDSLAFPVQLATNCGGPPATPATSIRSSRPGATPSSHCGEPSSGTRYHRGCGQGVVSPESPNERPGVKVALAPSFIIKSAHHRCRRGQPIDPAAPEAYVSRPGVPKVDPGYETIRGGPFAHLCAQTTQFGADLQPFRHPCAQTIQFRTEATTRRYQLQPAW